VVNQEAQRRVIAIAGLGEMFRATLSETTLGLYVGATSDLSAEQFDHAVCRAAKECRFMPAAAELRDLGFGATEDDAAEAWHIVERAARTLGPSRSPNFGDAIIHGSIRRLGGWIRLCESADDEWPFLRKEFLKHHHRLTMNGCPPEDGKRLIGISEQTNRNNGFHEQAKRSIYIVGRSGQTARAIDVLPPEVIAKLSEPAKTESSE
jgi:hypothetical protein